LTYRTRPHAEGMGDFTYRTREEVEQWKTRCPIARLKRLLLESGAGEAELSALEAEIDAEVEEAHRFAEQSAAPDAATASRRVYAEPRSVPPGANAPGSSGGREISFMQATLEALSSAMARDPKIFVMGEGIGKRGGNFRTTAGLYELYGPERLCDTP